MTKKYKSYVGAFKDYVALGRPKDAKTLEKISEKHDLGSGALANELRGINNALDGDVTRFPDSVTGSGRTHTLNVLVDARTAEIINDSEFVAIVRVMVHFTKSA